MGAAGELQEQRRSSSQQEQCGSSEEEALESKRQLEAPRPQMLQVGEVLSAPALEDLIPARPVHGTKSRRSRGETALRVLLR